MLKQNNHTEICIDKDGSWYFRGAEMKRLDIVQYFYRYLRRDSDGNYLIEIENDRCYVGVEDAPYVIKSVFIDFSKDIRRPHIELSLSDGNRERLNLSTPLRIGKDNVLYCRVRNGEFEARFSRPAYYQFCEYIVYDSRTETYSLLLNQHSYSLVLTKSINGKTRPEGREFDKPNVNGGSNVR
jgi:uncharacterized protein